MNYKEIVKKYSKYASEETMENLTSLTNKFIENPHMDKNKFLEEVEDLLSPYLTEVQAKHYISKFKFKRNIEAPRWSLENTDTVAKNLKIDLDGILFGSCDFHAAMYMVYSDYYQPKFTTEDYANLAHDFLNDDDWTICGEKVPGKIKWYLSSKEDFLED